MKELRENGNFDQIIEKCQAQVDAFMASNGGASAETAAE